MGSKVNYLVEIYCLVIRSTTEYCSTAFHHSLTQQDQQRLEPIQKTSLKIILKDQNTCYEEALTLVGLEKLSSIRLKRCLTYGLNSTKHPTNSRMFPLKTLTEHNIRDQEIYEVNFARTVKYKNSAIPNIQRMLNQHQVAAGRTTAKQDRQTNEPRGRGPRS